MRKVPRLKCWRQDCRITRCGSGQIVFTAEDAVKKAGTCDRNPVILVRAETTPEDIQVWKSPPGF